MDSVPNPTIAEVDDHLDHFDLTNIYPRTSGLPMTVWVGPRGGARHDARVKVCRVPGNKMIPDETAIVAIRPEPRIVAGDLSADAFAAVARWITLDRDTLLELWEGEIDGTELGPRLRHLDR